MEKNITFKVVRDRYNLDYLVIDGCIVLSSCYREEIYFNCNLCSRDLVSKYLYRYESNLPNVDYVSKWDISKIQVREVKQMCRDCYEKLCLLVEFKC